MIEIPIANHNDMTILQSGDRQFTVVIKHGRDHSFIKGFSSLEEVEDYLTMFNFDDDD